MGIVKNKPAACEVWRVSEPLEVAHGGPTAPLPRLPAATGRPSLENAAMEGCRVTTGGAIFVFLVQVVGPGSLVRSPYVRSDAADVERWQEEVEAAGLRS